MSHLYDNGSSGFQLMKAPDWSSVIEILTICTGNICRSPLAALSLADRLTGLDVSLHSSGTRARRALPMPAQAIRLGAELGIHAQRTELHRSRPLTLTDMQGSDLILAMAREHRREVVELDPSKVRKCFTIREFARLSGNLSDAAIVHASNVGGSDHQLRMASVLSIVAAQRSVVLPPSRLEDDDVVDPYGRSQSVYRQTATELEPALDAVERVIRLAIG